MLLKFPSENKINKWAETYITIYQKFGWLQAGNYLDKNVPHQFYPQIKNLAEKKLKDQK